MSDIFISYARSTESQAKAIGEALRALGYDVWRDDELPAHRAYAEVIEERLRTAKAVVVVWSAEAAKSQWVRAEANVAREAGTLVQLRLDGAIPPLPFNEIQCADMVGWNGDVGAQGWKKVVASVAELLAGDGASAISSSGRVASSSVARKHSICVLPFANMSGDPEQEYFSDGISEDIITDLSKVSALYVIARNTAFNFKGKGLDIPDIARKLGVSHVLEGSVRKAGNRVRITAQLIEEAGGHIWAERYDRDLDDIFALQDEISQAIVAALKVKLLPAEKKAIARRGTESPEAYDLYLMARKVWESGNLGAHTFESIVSLCQRAVAIDPSYAQAWALMAGAQGTLFHRFGQANDAGAAATEEALALDPDLGDAHAFKARQLHRTGRRDEAFAELEAALRLDPESYDVNEKAGQIYYLEGRFAEAAGYFERAASASETEYADFAMAQSSLAALGDLEGACRTARMTLERVEKALAEDPSNGSALSYGVMALAVLGERDKARQWIDRALLLDPDNQTMRYNFSCALSRYLGDAEGALALLGPVLAEPMNVESARTDPDLDPIRQDPRFRTMLAEAEARLAKAKSQESA